MEHQSATLLKEGMAALDAGNSALALQRPGIRKYPVISSLPREHFLNKCLGKLLTALKLR